MMCLPSQSTVPLATDCWSSKRPIVSKEIRPGWPLPYGGTPDGAFRAAPVVARERHVLWTLVQHFPLFDNVSPADHGEIVSLAREGEFSRCQTTVLEGHRVRDVACSSPA